MLREGIIYISPDTSSAKLSNIGRGREVAVHRAHARLGARRGHG